MISRFQGGVYTPVLRALVILLVSLLFLGVALSLWLPSRIQYARYNSDITDLNNEIRDLKSKVFVSSALKRNRHVLADVAKKIKQRVSQSVLIERLSNIVSTSGVEISDQVFKEKSTSRGVELFSQTLVLSGSYRSIRHFISLVVDDMPGLNVINRIELKQANGKVLSAHIEIDTYSAPTK